MSHEQESTDSPKKLPLQPPQLRKEIEDRTRVVHGLKELDVHNIAMEDDCPDNLDVTSSLIIWKVLKINISVIEGSVNMSEIHVSVAGLDEWATYCSRQ